MANSDRLLLVIGEHQGCADRYRQLLQDDCAASYHLIETTYSIDVPLSYRERPPDGILLESSLAQDDLRLVLNQVQSTWGEASPPVVMVGDADINTAVMALKAGVADYLVRGQLSPDTLGLSLRTVIENAELKRQLQQREELFQVSIENMLDCFGIYTAIRNEAGQIIDFRIDYVNQAACDNNQMSQAEQIGRGLCEVLPNHRESGLFDEYCQLVNTGTPLVKESLIYEDCYDGRYLARAYDIRASQLNDGFVAAWRDVTDRKQLELGLSQSNTHLRRLIETAPIGIAVGAADGTVKLINDAMLALHGYPREMFEQQGMNWRDFTAPEFADRIAPAMAQLREQGFLPPEQKELVRPDGSRVPVWISATQSFDNPDEHIAFAIDLTAQKQAEAALKASQQHYQVLAEAMPQMVWEADATGAVNYWNQRWYEYTGLTSAASLGLEGAEAIHPEDRDRTLTQWQAVIAKGQPFEVEHRIRRQDGLYRWFINRGMPTYNEQGQLTGWIGSITDIDERKRLEEGLRLVVRAANSLIYDWELSTNVVRRSEKLFDVVGFPPHEVPETADWWNSRIHPDDQLRLQGQLATLLAGQDCLFEAEYRVRHRDGHWVDVWDRSCAVRDEQGQVVRIVGATFDISEQKVLLRDHERTERALRESEDRLRLSLESAQLGTWDWNLVTHELIWDAGCKSMFGLPADADSSIEMFFAGLHPDDRDRLQQVVQRSLDPSSDGTYDVEYRTVGVRDHIERWIKATGQVYFNAEGQPLRFIGIVLDITQRKQLEAQRANLLQQEQAAREAAERANRIKDEFLAILSHELRSPLNPILGWAHLLRTKTLSAEVTARALEAIERNARLQTQLIDDLLDVARILRGKLRLEMAPVDPVFIIEAAVETVQSAADAKGIAIHTDLSAVGWVNGDAGRLQQVVWNLLNNAVKFTPEKGQVAVRLSSVNHALQIQVTDTGMGIHADFLPHIFESFRQEDTSVTRQFGGLGLGLAIVRYLVEAHGGTITANSPGEGQGATFTVRLPLLSPAPHRDSDQTHPVLAVDLSRLCIWVVDDSPDTLEIVTVLLEQYGAEVRAFATARAVLAALSSGRPDILISDIGMPEMDGYTLLQKIRSRSPEPENLFPAIALTAYARDAECRQALAAGFQRHIAKPFDPPQLALAIAELCQSP